MKKNLKLITFFIMAAFLVVSCSEDDDAGTITPVNVPPTAVDLSMAIKVSDGNTATITLAATDADGDTLTYSISGTDASLFQVSSSGVVTFITAPDFENPSDADANNVYLLTASVSDGSASDTESFTVTVTNDTSDDITTQGFDGTVLAMGPAPASVFEGISGHLKLL